MTKFKYELDYETQKKYISFHLFNHKKLHVSPIILSIALVGFGILSIVLKQYLLAIVSGILIIVVLGFLFFLTRKVFKMNLKGKEYFTVPLIFKKDISEQEKEIINKVHRARIDRSEYLLRSTKYRGATGIKPNNTKKRSKYDLTIDNDLMKRYSGELNIVLQDLEEDKAVNVVGRVVLSDFSLEYLKTQVPFVFKVIGE
jgi:hypothetical protein